MAEIPRLQTPAPATSSCPSEQAAATITWKLPVPGAEELSLRCSPVREKEACLGLWGNRLEKSKMNERTSEGRLETRYSPWAGNGVPA